MNESEKISYNAPNWFISEKEKFSGDNYWMQSVRYFSTYYNYTPSVKNDDRPAENISVLERGLRNSKYLVGKQSNINYNHIVNDGTGNTLQPLWVNSKKVKNMVERMGSQFLEQLSTKKISAKSLSERAQNERLKMWEDLMFKYDNRFQYINNKLQEIGVEYAPAGGREFRSKEEAEKWMAYDFKDSLELYATDIGTHIEWINDVNTSYVQSFIQDFATANYMGIYNYVDAGIIKQKRIPFYNLIYDYTSEDPFIRDGRFAGFIEYLPLVKVLDDRSLNISKKDKEDMMKVISNGEYCTQLTLVHNSFGNINWIEQRGNEVYVAKVTMFWNAPRDTEYNKAIDKYGNKHISKTVNKKNGGEYIINDLHKAVVIGNKWLADYGYEKNVVRAYGDKRNVQLPIFVLNGNIVQGDGISIIGTVADMVDKMDLYQTKISESVGKSKGKCHVFIGNEINKSVKELVTNLSTMGIDVIIGTSGEAGDSNGKGKVVQSVDMTLDPNVTAYIQLSLDLERQIEELLNLPKIAQGMQKQVIGLGVQQNTTSLASQGMGYMWYNLFKLNTLALNHAINMGRLLIASGNHNMDFVVGVRGEKMMKIIKDTRFEDCLIDITLKDSISESQKQLISQVMLGKAQRGEVDMREAVSFIKANTLTELENDLEYFENKREQKMQAQQAMQAQQQQALLAQEMQADLQKKKMEQDGQSSRTDQTVRGGILREAMKGEVKNQQLQQLE